MAFVFDPMPHTEARARTAGLPLVSRDTMDGMLPELRPYAFTITGLDVGDQMARVRDQIAAVPAGEMTWAKAKKEIAGELRESLGGKESERRAELLLRTHVFRGYAATRYRNLMAQVDVFPFWQYKTHGDGNVRPAHAALNGKIFPAGHEIWQRIFPPWDWGCRCLVVPLTARAAGRIQERGKQPQEDDGTLQKSQLVTPEFFDAKEADLINKAQRLPNGQPLLPSQTWSQSPWSEPGNVRHTWDLVQKRYDDQPEVLAAFKEWAAKTEIEKGVTVASWIGDGVATKKPRLKRPKKAPAVGKASTNVDEALAIAGIDPLQPITEAQAKALIEELKEAAPADGLAKISSIAGAPKKGTLTEKFIQREVQAFVSHLPPDVVKDLPQLKFSIKASKSWKGQYFKGGPVNLSKTWLKTEKDARATLYHELGHWVHRELPGDHPWVQEIKAHFERRTLGEALGTLPSYACPGKRDQWWEEYMGRVYSFPEERTHLGLEFPTRNFELLSDPARMAAVWSQSPEAREDIRLALKGLYP